MAFVKEQQQKTLIAKKKSNNNDSAAMANAKSSGERTTVKNMTNRIKWNEYVKW